MLTGGWACIRRLARRRPARPGDLRDACGGPRAHRALASAPQHPAAALVTVLPPTRTRSDHCRSSRRSGQPGSGSITPIESGLVAGGRSPSRSQTLHRAVSSVPLHAQSLVEPGKAEPQRMSGGRKQSLSRPKGGCAASSLLDSVVTYWIRARHASASASNPLSGSASCRASSTPIIALIASWASGCEGPTNSIRFSAASLATA